MEKNHNHHDLVRKANIVAYIVTVALLTLLAAAIEPGGPF